MTLKIKPIVEGHGEVEAVPVLLRRIAEECFKVFDVDILRPGRYPSSRLIKKQGAPGFRVQAYRWQAIMHAIKELRH